MTLIEYRGLFTVKLDLVTDIGDAKSVYYLPTVMLCGPFTVLNLRIDCCLRAEGLNVMI